MIPEIEKKSSLEIKLLQEAKLRELMTYVSLHSPYYKRLFASYHIDPKQIRTLEDLQQIPTTSKDDLQQFNNDFLCVSPSEIIDYATTSGTMGVPVTFGVTDRDLDRLAYNEAISLSCAGIQKGDIVQLMTTIDRRFMAGLAYFLGIRKLGASIIRVGAGIPEMQWDSILKYKPTYLIAIPSFLLKMIEYAQKNHIDFNKSSVKGVICIGESLRGQDFSPNALTKRITDLWNIKLYSTYASTEMSTTFTECDALQGGHHHPELIITEVIDNQGFPVPEGTCGELTITTLGIEAMPLIRFRTGDMVTMHSESCSCGRTTARISPVLGRKQQMIKYKGTTLYPPALMELLAYFEEVKNYIIEISTNEVWTDEILIKIGTNTPSSELEEAIRNHFRAKIRVVPKIEFYNVETLEKSIYLPNRRKPVHFIDKRKENL